MIKIFPEVPGWEFKVDEVSAGVYKVVGIDKAGHTVSSIGTDLEELIEQCKKGALAIKSQGSPR